MGLRSQPGPSPLIRPATPADAAALAELGAVVFRHTYGAAIPPALLDAYLARTFTPKRLHQALNNQAATYLVAAQAHNLIGYSKCAATVPPACIHGEWSSELVNLYIHPAYQGRGLGRHLLQQATKTVTAQQFTTLWLCVWRANQRAIDFYQRFDFTIVGTTEVDVDGVIFHDWVMQKTLRSDPQPLQPI